MILKKVKRYLVCTTGLATKYSYEATDPDEALMFAHMHERFLRVKRDHPHIPVDKIRKIATDECEIPNFRITSCILKEGD